MGIAGTSMKISYDVKINGTYTNKYEKAIKDFIGSKEFTQRVKDGKVFIELSQYVKGKDLYKDNNFMEINPKHATHFKIKNILVGDHFLTVDIVDSLNNDQPINSDQFGYMCTLRLSNVVVARKEYGEEVVLMIHFVID